MRALVNSDVLVAVLGPDWRTLTGSEGRRRLDDPTDWLRLEVGWAAEFDIPIVTVLLDGAEQPTPDQLPDAVQPLARAYPVPVRCNHLRTDVRELARVLDGFLPGPQRRRHSAPRLPATSGRVTARWAAALLGIVLGVVVAVTTQGGDHPAPGAPAVLTPDPTVSAVASPAPARITNLSDQGSVDRCATVRGTAPQPAAGQAYLLLARLADNRIHVLGPRLLVHRYGNWELRQVAVGGTAAIPAFRYTIMLVRTSAAGAASAEQKFRLASGDLAVTALPAGWKALDQVHVTRADSMACIRAAYPV
jgi:hypothetical protein